MKAIKCNTPRPLEIDFNPDRKLDTIHMKSDRFERVMAVVRRDKPDRVPWSIWGHYPAVDWLGYYSWEL